MKIATQSLIGKPVRLASVSGRITAIQDGRVWIRLPHRRMTAVSTRQLAIQGGRLLVMADVAVPDADADWYAVGYKEDDQYMPMVWNDGHWAVMFTGGRGDVQDAAASGQAASPEAAKSAAEEAARRLDPSIPAGAMQWEQQ